jgi:hypothetical protein
VDLLVTKFDRSSAKKIFFDDFIQVCVTLHILTEAFRKEDKDLDGTVTISYEQFLSMVLSCRV